MRSFPLAAGVVACAVFVAAAAAAAAAGAPAPAAEVHFRPPSTAIGCVADATYLRCDIRGGIKPLPPAPARCRLDWGVGFSLGPTGIAGVECAGDTVLSSQAVVVPYGTTWHRNGFRCASRSSGLRCTNAGGHGFLIGNQSSYRF